MRVAAAANQAGAQAVFDAARVGSGNSTWPPPTTRRSAREAPCRTISASTAAAGRDSRTGSPPSTGSSRGTSSASTRLLPPLTTSTTSPATRWWARRAPSSRPTMERWLPGWKRPPRPCGRCQGLGYLPGLGGRRPAGRHSPFRSAPRGARHRRRLLRRSTDRPQRPHPAGRGHGHQHRDPVLRVGLRRRPRGKHVPDHANRLRPAPHHEPRACNPSARRATLDGRAASFRGAQPGGMAMRTRR